ncbi:MAG: T9SS type A sorting domain-containing protein, partial [Paludibacteraceae bacterium]|nr:T9SS type A sorting domain-containing protein [Paludibacteraceae bacterium]
SLMKLDGSCDSIVTLNLKFYVDECDTAKVTLNDSIIEGESYLFGCQILTEAGTYVDSLMKLDGSCDSIVTLNLKYYVDECDTAKVTLNDSIKLGQSYLFGCQVITPTEIGDTVCVDTLQTYLGCDSIVTLTLTVNPNTVYTDTVANVCEGDMPYTWHGYVIYNDTVCSDTIDLTTYDSIVTLTLNVLRVQYAEVEDSVVCEGASCKWSRTGKEYKAGIYYDTARYVGSDCDSMIYQLSVREAKVTYAPVEKAVKCADGFPYIWERNLQFYNTTGIYYDTARYVGCGCDSVIYTLDLTVNPAPTDSTLDTTICDGDFIEWFGHKYSVAGIYYDTLYYTTGCDSVRGTLKLHVRKLTTEAPLLDTICAGEEYDWYGTKITEAGIYYDTIQYVGSACDSIARMLILTVNQPVTVEISETWCLAAAQAAYPDLNITGTGDYTRVGTSALGCDSTTIYHITILSKPEVPALKNLLFQPVVACGFPIILDSARVAVAAELAMTQADDIAKVDHFWFEMQLTPTSEFKQITSDVIMSYTEEPIQIRLVLYTECDEEIQGEPVAYEVVKPSPEEIAEYDEMPAVSKYNNWLLMINVNKITEMGFDVKEEDVTWYQVINDIDPAGQHIDDKEVGKGFYFTADMSLTGQYYAVIETDKTEINECGAILRTLVVKCTTDGKMRLVPNTIHEGETMEVRNINPDENTTLWMYDRDGKLLEKHVSDGQEQYIIQPEQNAGVYLLRVVNGKQEESFKYVITK